MHRFFVALCDQLGHPRCHAKQFKECLQCRDIPLSWLFQVLEANKLIHTCCRKLLKHGCIKLFTGNGEHCISGIDQCGNDNNSPFRFKTGGSGIHILNSVVIPNKLGVVQNLTMAFALEKLKNKPGMARLVRINLFAIKKLQCVEDGGSLFCAVLPCNSPQGILCSLRSVIGSNQHRKTGIVGSLISKVRCKTYTGNRVDQITKVNGLVR